jgi:pimeloyl-ACP methyl ester carboxylesterase
MSVPRPGAALPGDPHEAPLPALLAALEAAARAIRTPCGAGTMVWRTWAPEASATRPPLVLLHGGGGSWAHWVRNVATLGADRAIWCPDLPTLGDSADPPDPADVGSVADVVAEGLDALLPRRPQAFDLAGFSFGGLVGTLVAARRPGRVRRLVLVGVASLGLPAPSLALRSFRAARDDAARHAIHASNLRTLMLAAREVDPHAVALHARGVERARFDGRTVAGRPLIRDALPALAVGRVDAIYGALDAIVDRDPRPALAILQALRPGLRSAVIDGAGHWVQFERPAAFEAALRAFLDDAPLSPSRPRAAT